jgi:class 3 adenylate cyclase
MNKFQPNLSFGATLDAMATSGTNRGTALQLVSVVFADLVDHTARTEKLGPSATGALLAEYESIAVAVADRFGGAIEKFIGDAVVMSWGLEITDEHDAESAVRAGLDFIAEIEGWATARGDDTLALRVGIASGMVAARDRDSDGAQAIAGDVVNTASRIQARAEPRHVLVDTATMRRSSEAILYSDVGTHLLKGKADAVELHRALSVVAERGGRGRPDYLTAPLVGYEREFARVREAFNDVLDDGRDHTLVISGDAGTGKSRLGQELQNYIDGIERGVRWHWTRATAVDAGAPYGALVAAVRTRIGAHLLDGPREILAKIESSLEEFVADPDERRWLSSRLGTLLGADGNEANRDELFFAWSTWWSSLSSGGDAAVWVIDDAHLADEATLDFVQHLAATANSALLIVLLTRPELLERRPQLVSKRGTRLVSLGGLSDIEMHQLISHLIADPAGRVTSELAHRAAGLPLFAIELVRSLIDSGSVIELDGLRTVREATTRADAVPSTLAAIVLSRIELLDADSRAALAVASVLGAGFDEASIAALSAVDNVGTQLEVLVERELVSRTTDRLAAGFGTYSFLHPLVRQTVYETIPEMERVDLHLAAASNLASRAATRDLVVDHLARAHALDARANTSTAGIDLADWVALSASRAYATGAYTQALHGFELALATDPASASAAEWHIAAAEAAGMLGERDIMFAHAVVETTDLDLLVRGALVRAEAIQRSGQWPKSTVLLEPLLERIDELDPGLATRVASSMTLALQTSPSEIDRLTYWGEQAILHSQLTGSTLRVLEGLNGYGNATRIKNLTPITDLVLNEMVRLSRAERMPYYLTRALGNRSLTAFERMHYSAAEADCRESLELMDRSGLISTQSTTRDLFAAILQFEGKWDECVSVNRGILEAPRAADGLDRHWRLSAIEILSAIALARDETFDAELLEEFVPTDDEHVGNFATLLDNVRAYRERSNGGSGVARIRERLDSEIADGSGRGDFPWTWAHAVDWAIADGDIPVARELLATPMTQDLSQLTGADGHVIRLRRATVEAWDDESTADPSEIERQLRESLAEAIENDATLSSIHARGALARVLDATGRGAEAVEVRAAALARTTALRAHRLSRELRLN